MEEKQKRTKMGDPETINIPIQMFSVGDTTGKITPIRFRFQTDESTIETIYIDNVISWDEKNFVGIRETALVNSKKQTMEIRYNVGTQQWRIFQFL